MNNKKQKIMIFGKWTALCLFLVGVYAFLYRLMVPEINSPIAYEYINPNGPQLVKRGVVFAAYDKKGHIPDYVVRYLQELKKTGSDIVFISDNPALPSEINKIKDLVIYARFEKHGEYDFGSYKRGLNFLLDHHMLGDKSELILCNDSVYGPFYPLSDLFDQMNQKNIDFWGMTANNEYQYHLQSYFLYFKNAKLIQNELKDFLTGVKPERSRDEVIRNYEVKLTGYLQQRGYRADSVIPLPVDWIMIGDKPYKKSLNLTLEFSDILLKDFHFPFVKKSVLSYPYPCTLLLRTHGTLEYIRKNYPDFYELILRHLEEN